MKVYFGSRGDRFYIICPDFEEYYVFNRFGTVINERCSLATCGNWVEVDFISFVSENNGTCEVLFNDKKSTIKADISDCVMTMRKIGNYLGTIFTINHKDDQGMFTQVFFVSRKGIIKEYMLEDKLPISSWTSLN